MSIPRGILNNNPGNVRRSETKWQGEAQTQDDPDFVQFISAEWGIRAIARILLSYWREGLTTVDQVISRWAPPSENDTDAYVAAVCKECNVAGNDYIEIPKELPGLVRAIIRHENGEQPYTDEQINGGIALA